MAPPASGAINTREQPIMSKASTPRLISIDGVSYVCRHSPSAIVLSVWLAQKTRGNQELRVRFDDPWLNYGPIALCLHR
jgi:hypothetical protein